MGSSYTKRKRSLPAVPVPPHDFKEIINVVQEKLKPDEAGPGFYVLNKNQTEEVYPEDPF